MKKLFLLMGIAATCMTQFVNAQTTTPQAPVQQMQQAPGGAKMSTMTPQDRAQKQTDMMATQLKLSDDVKAKVQTINLKYAQKMEDLRKSGKSKEDMMAAMKQMRTDKDTDLKAVLTPEQYKMMTERAGQMRPAMQQAKPEN